MRPYRATLAEGSGKFGQLAERSFRQENILVMSAIGP
jgi:hypothetical protein